MSERPCSNQTHLCGIAVVMEYRLDPHGPAYPKPTCSPMHSIPPHGDAITFSYTPESACQEGTYTLLHRVHFLAH